jgi:hypothetical protein
VLACQYASLLNQVNNLLHHHIPTPISEGVLFDKATDVFVNLAPGATLIVSDGRLNICRGHTTSGQRKAVQDDSKVNDVGHNIANALATEQRNEVRPMKYEGRTHSYLYELLVHGAIGTSKFKLGLSGYISSG